MTIVKSNYKYCDCNELDDISITHCVVITQCVIYYSITGDRTECPI